MGVDDLLPLFCHSSGADKIQSKSSGPWNVLSLYGIYLPKLKIKMFYSLKSVRRRVHPPILRMTEERNAVR